MNNVAVLARMRPRWCKLVASEKKGADLRKNFPTMFFQRHLNNTEHKVGDAFKPFKVYMYCTKSKYEIDSLYAYRKYPSGVELRTRNIYGDDIYGKYCNGKVIGEFVCNRIEDLSQWKYDLPALYRHIKLHACVDYDELNEYIQGNEGYLWYISDVTIYDEPMDLNEFRIFCEGNGTEQDKRCVNCPHLLFDNDPISGYTRWCELSKLKPLSRPPQSWCYVLEIP